MAAPYYDNVMLPGAGGIRIPTEAYGSGGAGNPCGTMDIDKYVTHAYGTAHADWNLSAAETAGSYFSVTGADGAANAVFPAAIPGSVFVVSNASGQAITFKVTGQTGIAVANTKKAILSFSTTDVVRVTADT